MTASPNIHVTTGFGKPHPPCSCPASRFDPVASSWPPAMEECVVLGLVQNNCRE